MTPQVKVGKDFDEAASSGKRSPASLHEPQHLPPPPPAPRLSLPALNSLTTPQDSTVATGTAVLDDDDSYTAFYSSIPTVADSPYSAITPLNHSTSNLTTTSTATSPTGLNHSNNNSNHPYQYHPYSTSFTGSIEYQYHASLGSKTPMQIVAISNHKLNSDIYSSRSLSIHRRILVKNLLTLIYEMNPMLDWFEDGSGLKGMYDDDDGVEGGVPSEPLLGEDEQNGWIEQTLNAAGLSENDGTDKKKTASGATTTITTAAKSATPTDTNTTTTAIATTTATTTTQPNRASAVNGRSSPVANSSNDKNSRMDSASPGSAVIVSQPTPNIKNTTTTHMIANTSPPQPPLPRPTTASKTESFESTISTVLPSFPPAPTGPVHPRSPSTPEAISAPAPTARLPSAPTRTSNTHSSSSSSLTSPTKSSFSKGLANSATSVVGLSSSHRIVPLPRPKSIELPQSLNNYLAAVFDVDWSVELPTMEDSLFTFGGSSSPTSSSFLGTSPPKTTYQNGSLLSNSPKRRSISSTTSTTSSSSFSTLSKTISSSSSLSSVDSFMKGPSQPSLQTTPLSRKTPTSSEILVAKAVEKPYQWNNSVPSTNYGATGPSGSSIMAKSLPSPPQIETQCANGSGPAPIRGGAVPRANDEKGSSKSNAKANSYNNSSNSNNNRAPVSTSGSKPTTRKSTLVPGRRSSLQHSGQIPITISNSKKSPTSGPIVINNSHSSAPSPTIHIQPNHRNNDSSTSNTSPQSPPVKTSFASGHLPVGSNNRGSSNSGSGSNIGSPNIARRTSSLSPYERPTSLQRNPSSENITSSTGLPRPLLAKSFSSPIVIGPPSNSSSPLYDRQDTNHNHDYNVLAAGGFPVVGSRAPPQVPRKVIMLPPVSSSPTSLNPSNIIAPMAPPRSPSRAVSVSSYVLTPAPPPSAYNNSGSVSSSSGAPVLPPLFTTQNSKDYKSSTAISPSPNSSTAHRSISPTNGYQYHARQNQSHYQSPQNNQHLTLPLTYTLSNSDNQAQSRFGHSSSYPSYRSQSSRSPSPPLLSKSPSSVSSTSLTSTSTSSLSLPNHHHQSNGLQVRTAAGYGMKVSRSSPDLTMAPGSSSSDIYSLGSAQTSAEVLTHRSLPSLPEDSQSRTQQSYVYLENPRDRHNQLHQQSYSYGGSDSPKYREPRNVHQKAGMNSAPIPRIALSPSGPIPSQISSGSGGGLNRWASMKTMFQFKTAVGNSGK
ncbi:hypothetical protein FBU30_007453 [Linnemannia zychae]|nr:hypothetical protein FBU30_007453 [Linnemannia zychae]